MITIIVIRIPIIILRIIILRIPKQQIHTTNITDATINNMPKMAPQKGQCSAQRCACSICGKIYLFFFVAGTGKGGAWQGASVNTRINIYI